MSVFVQTDVKCYFHAYDLSGWFKANSLEFAQDQNDAAVWGVNSRINKSGLTAVSFAGEGLADHGAGLSETVLSAEMGLNERVITYGPTDGAAGEPAYSLGSLMSKLQPIGGAVGELSKFVIAGAGSGGLWFRGLIDAPKAARTASGNGTGRQLGAVAATERLYSALHIFAVSGTDPTLDVIVESDAASDFASATTRLTHPEKTAIGAELLTADGPITDDWFRVNWTIGGTDTPTFTFAVVIGRRP